MTIKVTYNITDVYMSQSVSPVYINVSYSDGGSSGGGVWGTITGTLSNQTDLQTALDGKFDNPTGDTTQYIAGDGSLVAFPITGQAGTLVREVRNNSGATITKGTVVYINGASGNRPTIAKAIATGDPTSAQTFGLVQADISNNSNGYIVAFGDLDGLDTQAITEGSQLYLSSTVLGGYTTVKQYAPNHLVYIGVVTRSHPNQGRIEVRIQNGYEMDELHDVSAQTPSNNDGLFYNTSTSLWENKSIATALGFTPANAATTLTINGVTYDLSANRSWTVAAGISGSGASGQITYWTGASAVSGSNNLFWDNANGRLGIGTNAPSTTLDIRGKARIETTGTTELDMFGGGGNILRISCSSTTPFIGTLTNAPLGFFTSATERGRFTTNGNLMLGTTSDLGVRLGVVGDTLLRGSGNTNTTTALTVQNSSSTNLFTVRNDGNVGIGTASPVNNLHINTSGAVSVIRLTTAGTGSTLSDGFAFGYDDTYGGLIVNRENTSFTLWTNNTIRLEIKANGQIRFMPLASAPGSPQAGDVYYNSTDNKHYGYNGTTWNAFY